ncbi:MAG: sigma-70 family RNA polymerase sigma factor [Elusimicrobiota bacterium]
MNFNCDLTQKDIEEVWKKYNKRKTKKCKNLLVEYYYSYVYRIALKLSSRLTSAVTADELVSHGVEGLYKAIDKFDPNFNVKFMTYAYSRIQGAMLDGLRKEDWVPRSVRARQSKIEKVTNLLESQFGYKVDQSEVLSALKIDSKKYIKNSGRYQAKHIVSLESSSNTEIDNEDNKKDFNTHLISETDAKPDSKLLRKEFLNKLLGKKFSALERKIVYLYYYENLTMKEISELLTQNGSKISESRISQIHYKILSKLKNTVSVNPEYFTDILSIINECNDTDVLF